jgi:hypothetical protein
MKHLFVRLLLVPAVLVILGNGAARAEQIDFSYQWSLQPVHGVLPGLPGSTGSVTLSTAQPGTGMATLGDPNGTTIPGATVTTTSSASVPPDSFQANFSMTVKLTDSASHQSGNATFNGTVSGTLTATTASLTGTFHNPLTETLKLGGHLYSITIDETFRPQPPGARALVKISADVTVTNVVKPASTPEPSSLVLGATAVLGLAVRRLKRTWAHRAA